MRASAVKYYTAAFFTNAVYEKPVRFNMTFPFSRIFHAGGGFHVWEAEGLPV
jgi:hypothetical protein